MRLGAALGAALLLASGALQAQTGDSDARRQQVKEAHARALKACEGKQGDERRSCMRLQLCAQAKDPKACQDRLARLAEGHAKAAKACEASKDQRAEHRECMRRELCAQSKDPARCEARTRKLEQQAGKKAKPAAKGAKGPKKAPTPEEACKGRKGEDYTACIRQQRGYK
jgi:hypothetical protein